MVTVIDHPLIAAKLTEARDVATPVPLFRQLLREIAKLMLFEVTRDYPTVPIPVQTPVGPALGKRLARQIVVIPVLRAGLGMADGLLDLVPHAVVGHLGFMRDENTLQPIPYYAKVPANLPMADVILVDPMLATGGSAVAAASALKQASAANIRLLCLVAAPEGIARMQSEHPDVPIYTAAIDQCLNDKGYIVPGLGDAGDRLFGTH